MDTLQAVFWDVDGTLADTEMEGHRVAFNAAFTEVGLPWRWDRDTYKNLLLVPGGGARITAYAKQQGGDLLSSETLDQLRALKQHHYVERIKSGAVSWRPGIKRILCELQQHGVQQWIVTTSGRESVNALLEASFPVGELPFQGCVTADDVSRRKPNPEAYVNALSLSGVSARYALAVEDSAAGLAAATGANISCLLTPSPWDQELRSTMDQAVAVLDHLGDPTRDVNVIAGPPCAQGMVTLEYLQHLTLMGRS
ncbi:MAG: HAD-IA family hydrolase [Prochlorococcus sp.]|nr:HAD-IA family hydrolase [Prochlorococcus sp.]